MSTTEQLTAQEIVQQQLETNAPACITCSFQAEDMVVLHMARNLRPDIPVLFLETGYHFEQTYAYRDRYAREWNLKVVNLMPELTVIQQETQFGKLYQTEPTKCCQMRKVGPLFKGLESYDVWLTGLRREQSPSRANLQKIEKHVLPNGRALAKVSPLAEWTNREVWAYLKANSIEPMPLYEMGYTSIGCEPCTALPADPNNPRSGRWGGNKLECGIHTFTEKE